jgi:hypothetical protein
MTIPQRPAESVAAPADRFEAQASGRTRRRVHGGSTACARFIAGPRYTPPDFSGSRRTRIGSSFIEQFVAGHDASDVLRELVQNEFDGGGDRLSLGFGTDQLEVVGNGRDITADGWERLSVIVGTGNVMGDSDAEVVIPKLMGSAPRFSAYVRFSALAIRFMCVRVAW